jgi:hypothetical protein
LDNKIRNNNPPLEMTQAWKSSPNQDEIPEYQDRIATAKASDDHSYSRSEHKTNHWATIEEQFPETLRNPIVED